MSRLRPGSAPPARASALLLLALAAACRGAPEPAWQEPLLVRLTGREHRWELRYAGADGRLDTPDDLRTVLPLALPEGVRVQLRLTSADSVYVLRLPDQGRREVAVPELVTILEFDSGEPGRHPLRGGQLCGRPRAGLDGELLVCEAGEFERWLAQVREGAGR